MKKAAPSLRDNAALTSMNMGIVSVHYYQFNIGDYASHTSHLEPLEDIAYRRMLDYCYLNEIGLPQTVEEISRIIRMRTHCDCIANVLREFFEQIESGEWIHKRVEQEISAYREKSVKASKAARKRWENTDANAMQTHSERNAKHKPLTINQEPDIKPTSKSATSPCPVEKIIEIYKSIAVKMIQVRIVPEVTRANISARWRSDEKFQKLEFWEKFFRICENNAFLSGQSDSRDGRKPFRADLNWLVKASNFAKVINGNYS